MEVIADLHLHSKYSRAVSRRMVVEEMAEWAVKKGIDLVGTGDWTHPLWLKELEAKLVETAPGLYKLKTATGPVTQSTSEVSPLAAKGGGGPSTDSAELTAEASEVKFLLSTEIASIYSQGGKLRRIHNLVLVPSFETVKKINAELGRRGVNLLSDGRPITGISSRDLAEMILGVDENCLVISAHAWTPWFSLYGSKSGFDSIKECYQDMSQYIYAIETGLSSSPEMNWQVKDLDKRAILSFSDAHSPEKLGREATVFEIPELSYETIRQAIIQKNSVSQRIRMSDSLIVRNSDKSDTQSSSEFSESRVLYTIEFYPEEGKYHYTGHRSCEVRQSPEETKRLGTTCPVCGKPLTVGVMHRVQQLASRELKSQKLKGKSGVMWNHYKGRPAYVMLVPLMEVIAEALGSTVYSQKTLAEYECLVSRFGSEFNVLLKAEMSKIGAVSGERVAEGIGKVRQGDLVIKPGYDGVFGEVAIWPKEGEREEELRKEQKQMTLF